jgi:hypothetical protein
MKKKSWEGTTHQRHCGSRKYLLVRDGTMVPGYFPEPRHPDVTSWVNNLRFYRYYFQSIDENLQKTSECWNDGHSFICSAVKRNAYQSSSRGWTGISQPIRCYLVRNHSTRQKRAHTIQLGTHLLRPLTIPIIYISWTERDRSLLTQPYTAREQPGTKWWITCQVIVRRRDSHSYQEVRYFLSSSNVSNRRVDHKHCTCTEVIMKVCNEWMPPWVSSVC